MKKLLTGCFICVFLVSGCSILPEKEKKNPVAPKAAVQKAKEVPVVETETAKVTPPQSVPVVKEPEKIKKADLYSENNELSLSTIVLIAGLDDSMRAKINNYIKNSTVYYVEEKNDSVCMIVSNADEEKFQRHGIEFVEISNAGVKKVSPLVNTSDENDEKDVWEFDEETKLPLRHVNYDSDGEVDYAEFWNYSADNPVKYELKDSEGKTISIKKEIQDNDSNMRIEHLIYDSEGNTKLNISANYEGPDITRFTYYNSEEPADGVIIMSKYDAGQKVEETVYSSDYKVKNVYESSYQDGKRAKIKIFDNERKELEEILSE